MFDDRLKNLEGRSRRTFLRWATTAGALLALERSKVLDVIADSGGSAMADESCGTSNRSVHLVGGDGGVAWFQLLWPHVAVADAANGSFAFHAPGGAMAAGPGTTDKPFRYGPEAPWTGPNTPNLVSAFMAGRSQAHSRAPASPALGGGSMLAAAAAIQRATPALVPVICIGDEVYGTAPGAPELTVARDASGVIELFNTSASKVLLAAKQDAELFDTYYKAFVSLQKAAGRPTWTRSLRTGKAAASLLGNKIAAALAPTPEEFAAYGISASTPESVQKIGRTLIITAKAFKLGLTQCVILPAMLDDPHQAFGNMALLTDTVTALGAILNAFMADLGAEKDPGCPAKTYADTTIITVHGDTPKTPLVREGWPDDTPAGSNWMYVMGNGYLKTGWFGGVGADGSVKGFDPGTGNEVDWPTGVAEQEAARAPVGAAVLYAIAKGDMRRVRDFYTGPNIDGLVRVDPI